MMVLQQARLHFGSHALQDILAISAEFKVERVFSSNVCHGEVAHHRETAQRGFSHIPTISGPNSPKIWDRIIRVWCILWKSRQG